AAWIGIDTSPSGSGPGSVRFSVQPTAGAARSGTLTVAGRTITVSQSQGCAYTIAPENTSVPSSGGAVKVSVSAGAGCGWTAASAVPWITIDSGASGSGDGTVQLTVAATTGPTRSGTVTIAGRTLTVSQGQGCTFAIAPET